MMKHGLTVMTVGAAILSSGCNSTDCTDSSMVAAIRRDIINDKRSPDEYELAEIKSQGNIVYVGMKQKASPLYRRHYFFDPKTCKVVDMKIDQ